jgi:hypothetical protein
VAISLSIPPITRHVLFFAVIKVMKAMIGTREAHLLKLRNCVFEVVPTLRAIPSINLSAAEMHSAAQNNAFWKSEFPVLHAMIDRRYSGEGASTDVIENAPEAAMDMIVEERQASPNEIPPGPTHRLERRCEVLEKALEGIKVATWEPKRRLHRLRHRIADVLAAVKDRGQKADSE